jgi:hypothetical protein
MLVVITRKVDLMFELCKYDFQDLKLHWKGIGKRTRRPSASTRNSSTWTVASRGSKLLPLRDIRCQFIVLSKGNDCRWSQTGFSNVRQTGAKRCDHRPPPVYKRASRSTMLKNSHIFSIDDLDQSLRIN